MRVMAVDDDPEFLEALTAHLRDHGFEVSACASGYDALDQLRVHRYDVLVLDLSMPGLSGIQLARRIRADARHGGVPIVMMSALTEMAWLVESPVDGANLCVHKAGIFSSHAGIVAELLRVAERRPFR